MISQKPVQPKRGPTICTLFVGDGQMIEKDNFYGDNIQKGRDSKGQTDRDRTVVFDSAVILQNRVRAETIQKNEKKDDKPGESSVYVG